MIALETCFGEVRNREMIFHISHGAKLSSKESC